MRDNRTFFSKHFLMLIYLLFLGLDCYFLYKASYRTRLYSKTILMVFLILWFHRNTALRRRMPAQSFYILFCAYAMLILSLVSDACSIGWTVFTNYVYLLLYIPIYFLFLLMLIQVVKRAHEKKKLVFYVKKVVPSFLLVFAIALIVLWKAVGFGTEFHHWCLYFNALTICLTAAVTANMWGYPQLQKSRTLFATSVFFLILTNATFCFDELYYNRRHHILDVFVALGNGAVMVFMLLGVISVLKHWKKLEY